MLSYENAEVRNQACCEAEKNGTKLPKKDKDNKDNPEYNGKYTDASAGSSVYGGWKLEGLKQYSNLGKAIQNYRKDNEDHCREVEKTMLAVVRGMNGITDKKKKKGKKRASAKPEMVIDEGMDLVFEV